jgi:hypothetical protein
MSIKLIERDGGPFESPEELGDGSRFAENLYFEVSMDGIPYFYCHVQRLEELGYIHAYSAGAFSKGLVRQMRADFTHVKKVLRHHGISIIMGIVNEGDVCCSKWSKFVRLLGFDTPEDVVVEGIPSKRVFMEV